MSSRPADGAKVIDKKVGYIQTCASLDRELTKRLTAAESGCYLSSQNGWTIPYSFSSTSRRGQ
jgi:hypothetical protein